MLDLISSGLLSLWLDQAELASPPLPFNPAAIATSVEQLTAEQTDPTAQKLVEQYLKDLTQRGIDPKTQGVWLQSDYQILTHQDGFTPQSAASITKVATSLVSLKNWGPHFQFPTIIGTTGILEGNLLKGDLIVQGGSDPLFVWETAIELGNALNQLGISQVTGNLVIVGDFAMNFQRDPAQAGSLLKQALDSSQWPAEATQYFQQMPVGTLKPLIKIAGTVQVDNQNPPQQRILLKHHSLPLIQLLKQMNIYSNNDMAEMLGKALGGGPVVAERAAWYAGVPATEIRLINGSGLGQENQISPRAAVALFQAIQSELQRWSPLTPNANRYTIADVFPVAGLDKGTLKERRIPLSAVVKTGTLSDVSALAGVLPSRDRGLVWFAILNRGTAIEELRQQQDNALQAMIRTWGMPLSPQADVAPTLAIEAPKSGQDLADQF